MDQAEAFARLERVYQDLGQELARTAPFCYACGECCHFARFGHRLYASTLEARYAAARGPLDGAPPRDDPCPFLAPDGRCNAREARPLGCRIYFCDPVHLRDRTSELYERYHARIKGIHDEAAIPFEYGLFTRMLEEQAETLGIVRPPLRAG